MCSASLLLFERIFHAENDRFSFPAHCLNDMTSNSRRKRRIEGLNGGFKRFMQAMRRP